MSEDEIVDLALSYIDEDLLDEEAIEDMKSNGISKEDIDDVIETMHELENTDELDDEDTTAVKDAEVIMAQDKASKMHDAEKKRANDIVAEAVVGEDAKHLMDKLDKTTETLSDDELPFDLKKEDNATNSLAQWLSNLR